MWIVYYNIKPDNIGGKNGQQPYNVKILQKGGEDTDISNSFEDKEGNNTRVVFIFLSSQAYQKGKTNHPFHLKPKIPLMLYNL